MRDCLPVGDQIFLSPTNEIERGVLLAFGYAQYNHEEKGRHRDEEYDHHQTRHDVESPVVHVREDESEANEQPVMLDHALVDGFGVGKELAEDV